eukprot:gene27681-36493_t
MDRYLPVRARMPHRCEVITQVSAGKSWSAALTVNGDVYTWGKGVRGEIGQGKSWFSMGGAQVRLRHLQSDLHLLQLRKPMPQLLDDNDEQSAQHNLKRRMLCFDSYNHGRLGLHSCKSNSTRFESAPLLSFKETDSFVWMIPTIPEVDFIEKIVATKAKEASAQKTEEKNRRPLTGSDRVRLTLKQQSSPKREAKEVETVVVILPEKGIEGEECKDMRYEEKIMKKYLYFSDLQKALRGMNGMMYGVRKVFAAGSATVPTTMTMTRSGDEVVLHSLKASHLTHEAHLSPSKSKASKQKVLILTNTTRPLRKGKVQHVKALETHEYRRPTLAFTVASVRFQQLCLHPSRRAPIHTLALLARRYPRTASANDRFLRDAEGQAQRYKKGKEEARVLAARKRLAAAVLKRLIAKQNRTRDILAQADTTKKPPPPPPGPPPREAVRAALQEEKDKRNEKEEQIFLAQASLEVAQFGRKNGGRAPEKPTEFGHPAIQANQSLSGIFPPSTIHAGRVDDRAEEDRLTLLDVFNKKIRTVLGHSCLSPRLPREMIRIVKPSRHYASNFKGILS